MTEEPTIIIEMDDPDFCEDAWDQFVIDWVEDTEQFSLAELRTAFFSGWKAKGEKP